jgi:hypothetical protein
MSKNFYANGMSNRRSRVTVLFSGISQLENGHKWRSIRNFNHIVNEIWKQGEEIYLCPYFKCDHHCPNFNESHAGSMSYCEEIHFLIS